jgi:Transglutaminase-like superfamily
MGRLSKFAFLPTPDRSLLVVAIFLLATIRLGLRVLPFARLRTLLAGLARIRSKDDGIGSAAPERAVWAVETASRQFPSIGTCLTQALAMQVLLARAGCESRLRIGVTRNAAGTFIAHAWLEKDGVIVIGGAEHRGFTPMPALDGLE